MKKINYFFLAFFLLVVSSCDPDDGENGLTSVEDDKQNIKAVFNNSISCVKQIRDGEFSKWLTNAIKLEDGEALNEDWIDDLTDALDETAGLDRISDDERFVLATYAGTYTWNRANETWTKTANSSGQMVLVFPATPSTTTNNCEFKITQYTDAKYVIDQEDVYLPQVVKASLRKDNTEIMNLDLNASFDGAGTFVVPVNFSLSLKLSPVTYAFSVKRLNSKQFETRFAFQESTDCATTIATTVSFAHDDYENYIDDENAVNTVQAEITKGDIAIGGSWDVKAFNTFSDPTTEQTNSTLDLKISQNGEKIGDLKLKDENNDTELFVFYKDGSSENASVYYDPFITDLDKELQAYLGEDAVRGGRKAMFSITRVDFKAKFEQTLETLAFWN